MFKRLSRQWLAICCLTTIITACGGGGSGGSNSNTNASSPSASAPNSSPTPAAQTPSANGAYSVHVTWTAPTTRADGSALAMSALEGYRLFYIRDGSSPNEDASVTIGGGATTSADLSLNIAGTYTFAITAIDSSGVESVLSAPVSVTLN